MRRISMILGLGTVVFVALGCASHPRVNNRMRPYGLGHYPGDGGLMVTNRKKVCIVPPVQAVKTVKLEAKNKLGAKLKEVVAVELSSDLARDESLHSLYEQGQATLFLQFMAYRLCEGNLNGTISDATYLAELEKINARGETLLKEELKLATQRTATTKAQAARAGAEAQKAKNTTDTIRESLKVLENPEVAEETKDAVRKSLSGLLEK